MNVGLLRLHNVYGPGNAWDPERSQALPSLIRKAINYPAEDFTVWGSGNQYRDFLFIDDGTCNYETSTVT
jgi:nucleoside-diphosphate-sugar epimerase